MNRPESVKLPIHVTREKILRDLHVLLFPLDRDENKFFNSILMTGNDLDEEGSCGSSFRPPELIFEDLGGVRSRSRTPKSERRGRFSAPRAAALCGGGAE